MLKPARWQKYNDIPCASIPFTGIAAPSAGTCTGAASFITEVDPF
jgi:hypothetical protein